MKKLIFLGIVFLLMLNIAYAQEAKPITAGIGADSPFYFLDRLVESIQLKIAESEAPTRLRLKVQFMNERIAELHDLKSSKPQFALNTLAEIQKNTDDLAEEAKNIPESREIISQNMNNSMIVLMKVKERFETDNNPNNDNAISGINIAISNQATRIGAMTNKPNNQTITIGGGY